jgi:Symplekin tight junction protein C terminal
LDHEELFTDQVWFAAFDYMSGTFISSEKDSLPLGFMRSVILVCTKHETLHSWICNVLLKRLVEGEIWNRDERQWEGWMRCAKMLEGRVAGAPSSAAAVAMLPDLQQLQYRSKWT